MVTSLEIVQKRTSQGNGMRKRGSFKQQSKKRYRGQGKALIVKVL